VSSDSCEALDLVKCLRLVRDDFQFDPENDSDIGLCVQLTSIVGGSASLLLKADSSCRIKRVQAISQCRRAEIFTGKNLEYLSTVNGKFIDSASEDEDEMAMFRIDVRLDPIPSCQVQLKLTGLSDNCWVMGLFTSVESKSPQSSSNFDLSRVNSLLDSKELSDGAAKFKGLFEAFNGGQQMSLAGGIQRGDTSPGALMTLMSAAGKHLQTGDRVQNNVLTSQENSSQAEAYSSENCHKCQNLDTLEKKIMQRIDDMEKRQNEKFDQLMQIIMSSLETKE